jgi:cytochrome c551
MKKLGLSGLIIGMFIVLLGCNEAGNQSSSTNPETAEVPMVYKQNCMSCHGGNLQGVVGPSLQKIGSELSLEELENIIRNGKGSMPGFANKLDQANIDELVLWLSEQK